MTGFLPHLSFVVPDSAAPVRARAVTAAERELPLALEAITSAEQFEAASVPAGDLVPNGRVLKFLVDNREPTDPRVLFVNGNFTVGGVVPEAARYHYTFAAAVLGIPESLEEFNQQTYFTQTKRYVAGVVHTYLLDDAAGQADGLAQPLYAIQFYPQDVVRESGVVSAVRAVGSALSVAGARLAFVPTGSQQTTGTVLEELAALEVSVVTLDSILDGVNYLPLNRGEAWGHLRIFPPDLDDLRPTDVVVFDELPLDLSVVAGVLTRAVQDTNSHVNLKSKERGTPNAVLRDAGPDHPRLRAFADRPVHLVVRGDDFSLEETSEEVVAAKLAERMDRPLVRIGWEPETELRSYDEMAAGTTAEVLALARRYGAKATNLGFLAHRDVLGRVGDEGSPSAHAGYDLVPRGFAVPFQLYQDFLDHPPNQDLREKLGSLVAAEQAGGVSPRERAERVAEVHDAFLAATFPAEAFERVRARLEELLPGVEKVKVRSSANAEDIPGFDGAGLHDSFAADTDKRNDPSKPCRVEDETGDTGEVKRKVKPKSLLCAVKGVYASAWSKRAIEERNFARIDQSSVAMGLAIVPAYDSESEVAANAVVVTRVLNTQDVYGYSLSVQEGNNLVTNPDPGTWSEVTVAGFISDAEPVSLTVTRYAKPTNGSPPRTAPVLERPTMLALVELAKTVERAYCAADPDYYDGPCAGVVADNTKPQSLDLELKLLEDGRLVCKQVRQFGGR